MRNWSQRKLEEQLLEGRLEAEEVGEVEEKKEKEEKEKTVEKEETKVWKEEPKGIARV